MGYAVLHLEKAKGADTGMSAHIERSIDPKNVDKKRTHLNRELIQFPQGVGCRSQAIEHRIEEANLKRKIGKNQVRAIRVLLSGSKEDMTRIQAAGQLTSWCYTNLDWLKETYGEKNVVSAVLHMDEQTPHIHATIVPIVIGERRGASQRKNKYRKKDATKTRLCADDVINRLKLKEYQNSYAEKMRVYGLERGIEGSQAKHISTAEYYRDLLSQTDEIQENLQQLIEQEERVELDLKKSQTALKQLKNQASVEKFKDSSAKMVSTIADGISTMLGSESKVQKLERERDYFKKQVESLVEKIEELKDEAVQEKKIFEQGIKKEMTDKDLSIARLEAEKKKIMDFYPDLIEYMHISDRCRAIGMQQDTIKKLMLASSIAYQGKLFCAEYKQHYEVESEIRIQRSQTSRKLIVLVDGYELSNWFKLKRSEAIKELQTKLRNEQKPTKPVKNQGRGRGL